MTTQKGTGLAPATATSHCATRMPPPHPQASQQLVACDSSAATGNVEEPADPMPLVVLTEVAGGDHRLSSASDLQLLEKALLQMLALC